MSTLPWEGHGRPHAGRRRGPVRRRAEGRARPASTTGLDRPGARPPGELPRGRGDVLRRHRAAAGAARAAGVAAHGDRDRVGRGATQPRDRRLPGHPRRRRAPPDAGRVVVRRALPRARSHPGLDHGVDRHRRAGPGGRVRRIGRPRLAAGGVRGGGAGAVAGGPQALHGAHPAGQRLARPRALPRRRRPRRPPRLGPAGAVPGHVAHHGGPRRLGVHVRAGRARRPRRHRRRRRGAVRRHVRPRAGRRVRRARRRLRAVPPAPRPTPPRPRRRAAAARPARPLRRGRLARLLRHPARQGGGVLPLRQVRGDLPRRRVGQPGQRRSDRRRRGLAGGHRRVARRGAPLRLAPRRDGRERAGRPRLRGRGPLRRRARRRGRRRRPGVLPGRPHHAAGPPGGGPGRAGRLLRHHPAPPRAVGRRDARGRRAGRRLARHRDRARLLHGAGPARRPGRRRVRAGRVLRRPGHAARAAVLRAVGPRRALAGPDAPRRHAENGLTEFMVAQLAQRRGRSASSGSR